MIKKWTILLLLSLSFTLSANQDMKKQVNKEGKTNNKKIESSQANSKTETVTAILDKIKKNYEEVDILEAEFEQVFFHKAYKRKKKSSGSVVFTKDLKMKWSYKSPEEKYIISNNTLLWIYEPENEQAFKANIKGSELESAAKFLLGKLDVLKKYNLALENSVLKLTPKTESNYKVIYLTLNKDYRISETKMIDNFDNENIITYKQLKINQTKLGADFFNFIPPDHIEIIEKDKE